MAKKINNKYFVKNTASGSYSDVTTLFDGVNVLSVGNMSAIGKAVNIYTAQWVDSQTEDMIIAGDNVIRENVDITVTFVVGQRYANATIDTQSVYDAFVNYMTNTDVWIRSAYVGKQVHCVALDGFEPKKVKLQRGSESYILGEIKLHTIEKPSLYA